MKRLRLWLPLALALTLVPGLAGSRAASLSCEPGADLPGTLAPLPAIAPLLASGGTLHVLAVGSATMFAPSASLDTRAIAKQLTDRSRATPLPETPPPSDLAFPFQMAKALEAQVPGLTVDITLRGGRGLSAAEMLDQLKSELKPGRFQLVLWQTGTVEAVRNLSAGDFAQVLSDGATATTEAGADLVLIDPQYSRFLQTNSNLDPYLRAMQTTAAMPGVILFRRFDLMRNWANDSQIDLERAAKPDRLRTVEALHACLGHELARLVAAAGRS